VTSEVTQVSNFQLAQAQVASFTFIGETDGVAGQKFDVPSSVFIFLNYQDAAIKCLLYRYNILAKT